MRAHLWGWLYYARPPQWRLPQWRFPASPGLGGPRAIHEYCRAPYDLSVACSSVVGLNQRLNLYVGVV